MARSSSITRNAGFYRRLRRLLIVFLPWMFILFFCGITWWINIFHLPTPFSSHSTFSSSSSSSSSSTPFEMIHPGFDSSKIWKQRQPYLEQRRNNTKTNLRNSNFNLVNHTHRHNNRKNDNTDNTQNNDNLTNQQKVKGDGEKNGNNNRIPKQNVCSGYDGVLHIESGDAGGATGTTFFIYIVNQLIYADMYNLLPFIHLNNRSRHVYDSQVHSTWSSSILSTATTNILEGMSKDGTGTGSRLDTSKVMTGLRSLSLPTSTATGATTISSTSFTMLHGMTIDFVSGGYRRFGFGAYPGKPKLLLEDRPLTPRNYTILGTGVWNHYFEPVSDFDPDVRNHPSHQPTSCPDQPLLRMHYNHLNPGLLLHCPWSVKSWPYNGLPKRLMPETSLKEWYKPMREKGSAIVQKYIRFRPDINEAVHRLFEKHNENLKQPQKEQEEQQTRQNPVEHASFRPSCLAMHIRHSDKGGINRKRIPLNAFLPYVEAYRNAGGTTIVLATDSMDILTTIEKEWDTELQSMILRQSNDMLRSSDRKAVFVMGEDNHDRTNREVLIDILAMSKCQFLLHGFSAVSEAVMYLNLNLHNHSVDLEDHPLNHRLSPNEFETMVRTASR